MRRILNTAGSLFHRLLNNSRFTFSLAVIALQVIVPVLLWRIVSIHGVTGIIDLKGILAVVVAATVGWICVRNSVRTSPFRSQYWWGLALLVLFTASTPFLIFAWIESYLVVAALLWVLFCASIVFSLWSPAFQSAMKRRVAVLTNAVTALLFFGLLSIHGVTGEGRTSFEWRIHRLPNNLIPDGDSASAGTLKPEQTEPDNETSGAIVWPGHAGYSDTVLTEQRNLPDNWWSELETVWTVPVGPGWSGMAATETHVFTLEQLNNCDTLTSRDINDGHQLWTATVNVEPYKSPYGGDGPRATPAVFDFTAEDGSIYRRVVAAGPRDNVICVRAADGTVIWQTDLTELSTGEPLHHGLSASPLIVNTMVIVSPSASHGPGLCALSQSDGRLIWKAESSWKASYSSPIHTQLCGVHQILFHAGPGILSLDIESGKTLWSFEWTNEHQTNASLPVVVNAEQGLVAVSTGYGTGTVLLKTIVNSSGKWSVSEVWKSKALKTKFSSLSRFDRMLVGLDDGILSAVDLETGERLWKKGRYRHGQSLRVGNQLIVLSESGELVVVAPEQTSPAELANLPVLTGKCWSAPILSEDSILIRNDEQMTRLRIAGGRLHPETDTLKHKD
ncbi:MAG: PQQ-binding-like beta-propeller repeat protein [Planctomyces sp.]|nr:PQQ-binding-like beta-propeller repeat protein [Planctomyces sp.]